MSDKVVGITGARGVIGSYLVDFLEREAGWRVEAYGGNILDERSVSSWAKRVRPDVIFHLAAVVSVAEASSDKVRSREVNECGPSIFLRTVIEAVGNRPLRFLYASTCHVYASKQEPIRESDAVSPLNHYATTKLAGEVSLRDEAKPNSNVELVIARIFGVYSSRQREGFLYPALVSKISGSQSPLALSLEGWNNVRDFLHASQIAQLLIEVGGAQVVGVFNVGSGQGRNVKDFAELLFDVELIVSDSDASTQPTALVADVTKLRRVVGDDRFDEITRWKALYGRV